MNKFLMSMMATAVVGSAFASPIAWWKFDEASGTTANASAGSVNGTLNGSTAFTGGISGNAVSLVQATNDFVDFGNNYGLVGTDYTVAFWVKTSAGYSNPNSFMVGKHHATTVAGYLFGMNGNSGYGATNKAWAYQSSFPGNQPISTTSVNDGSWHQVVTTLSGSSHSIYVDGVLQDTRTANPMVGISASLKVGGMEDPSGNQISTFSGLVDDFQIYDSALNAGDIGFMFANPGSAVPEPATMAVLGLGALAVLRRRRR